jgi:hypothetical protein
MSWPEQSLSRYFEAVDCTHASQGHHRLPPPTVKDRFAALTRIAFVLPHDALRGSYYEMTVTACQANGFEDDRFISAAWHIRTREI